MRDITEDLDLMPTTPTRVFAQAFDRWVRRNVSIKHQLGCQLL